MLSYNIQLLSHIFKDFVSHVIIYINILIWDHEFYNYKYFREVLSSSLKIAYFIIPSVLMEINWYFFEKLKQHCIHDKTC